MSPPRDARRRGAPAPLSVAQEALWYVSLLDPKPPQLQRDGLDPQGRLARRRGARAGVQRDRAAPSCVAHHLRHRRRRAGPESCTRRRRSDLRADRPVSELTGEEAERRAVAARGRLSRVPYDLRRGPLVRPRLFRFPADEHRLYLAMHHIVFDGVSIYRVVLPELIALYDAFAAGRALASRRAADHLRRLRALGAGVDPRQPALRGRLGHWHERLGDLPELALPFDRPRPAAARYRGGVARPDRPGGPRRSPSGRSARVPERPSSRCSRRAGRCSSAATPANRTSSSRPPPTCASARSSRRSSATA